MRLSQVSERIKEAPAQALRSVFAGIGQVLLVTDKLRNKSTGQPGAQTQAPADAAEAPQAVDVPPANEAPQAADPSAAAPDPDTTGNVRLLTGEAAEAPVQEVTAEPSVTDEATVASEAPVAAEAAAAEAVPAAEAMPAAEAVPAEGGGAPLPNYDDLTIASLRARLRNLSVEQVRELAEYERAHAARPEVITMFERRVAKLEAGA